MQLTVEADASLQAAIDGAPWRLSVGLRPKRATLALDVRLASIASFEGVQLGIEATGEQLAAWSGVLGRALPGWGPYRLSAQARYVQGSLQVDGLSLSLDGLPMLPSRLEIGSGKCGVRCERGLAADARGQARRCGVLARSQRRAMARSCKDRWRCAPGAARRARGLHAQRRWTHHARGRSRGLRPGTDRPGRRAGAAAAAGGPAPGPPCRWIWRLA